MEHAIIFITKAYHHYETITEVLRKHGLEYPVLYGEDSDACLKIAREQLAKGAKVIISTDYICNLFMRELNVSVITIRRSGYSFVSRIAEELKTTDRIAILSRVGGYDFSQAAEEARLIYPTQVYTYNYTDEADAARILKKLKASGFRSVICPSWVGQLVEQQGMRYAYILLPEKDILEAVRHAEFQLGVYRRQMLNASLISKILDMATEGMIAVDVGGILIDVNRRAGQILGIRREDLLGKHYADTALAAFDRHGALSKCLEVRRNILTLADQTLIYDIQPIGVDGSTVAQVIIFNTAQQIKEAERKIRMKEMKSGSVATARFSSIIGGSPAIKKAVEQARRYAQVNSTVLIMAPSGSGKELFAQSIHNAGPRAGGPFVVINCAALPESVLESLLFGYEPGTFTGGNREGKAGLFELAHGGTVFLDEVGEMPLNIQARFLRVLQEREVVRIGGTKSIPIDIRVLAATNRDMWQLVKQGVFREDLYHRISTLLLEIPPLSERKEDIAPLAQYFVCERAAQLKLPVTGIDAQALHLLSGLELSGNVRQLNNILERAMVLASSDELHAEDIQNALPRSLYRENEVLSGAGAAPAFPGTMPVTGEPQPASSGLRPAAEAAPDFRQTPSQPSLKQQKSLSERELILQALTSSGGNRTRTAGLLGISTATLWRKMKALEIAYKPRHP